MLDQLPDWKALSRDQRIEMVAPMVAEGLSSSQIANRFRNTTRNTIIGLCSRHDMKLGANRPKPPKPVKAPRPHGNKGQPKANAVIARAARKPPTPPAFEPEPFDMEDGDGVDVTTLVGLMELQRTSCRWPLGTATGSAQLFCGAHTHHGPYCDIHSTRAGIGYGRGPRP